MLRNIFQATKKQHLHNRRHCTADEEKQQQHHQKHVPPNKLGSAAGLADYVQPKAKQARCQIHADIYVGQQLSEPELSKQLHDTIWPE